MKIVKGNRHENQYIKKYIYILFYKKIFLKRGGAQPLSPLSFFLCVWGGGGGGGGNTAMTNPPLSLETTVNIFV